MGKAIKKKNKTLLVVLAGMLAVLCALVAFIFAINMKESVVYAAPMFGKGTQENPYLISSGKDLNNVRYETNKYFRQTNNIDMSGYQNFVPIGSQGSPFDGYYDGGQFQIMNLQISAPERSGVGLFGAIRDSEIKNVKISNSKIVGKANVGGIVGVNKGTVSQCINESEVIALQNNAGGIVGLNSGGFIEKCANKGSVEIESGMCVGGIVGTNYSEVVDCYNTGRVLSNSTYCGGIAGLNDNNILSKARIERCFNVGQVSGNIREHIAGDNWKGNISACYFQKDLFKISNFDTGTANTSEISYEQFSDALTFRSWDFDLTWRYIVGVNHPILQCEYVSVRDIVVNENLQLHQGDSITLNACIVPTNATVKEINYRLTSGDGFCTLSGSTITIHSDAPIKSKATFEVSAENIIKTVTVEVIKIPVSRFVLTNSQNRSVLTHSEALDFYVQIEPANATFQAVNYNVTSDYAHVTEDGKVTVRSDASLGLTFDVIAELDDDKSIISKYTVSVIAVDVSEVTFTCDKEFKVTESLALSARISPANATDQSI